ncbi:PKD domain-containing protein [Rhodonellum sp.]|uniref:PKD domain-containing protein n=1 Tax=Rhodonellum sp. TaxID=2231180 RepID=UPI00271AE623|nr:PKD domain-containing protein [Rhodonellum sp.]MDO9554096.1 PKD domain-containing protein [Rhodonellum sp.]
MIELLKKVRTIFLFSLIFFLGAHQTHAQLTTVGKEFWFGFMENNAVLPDARDRGVVIVTASETTTGSIVYAGNSVNFSLNQGQQFVLNMDDTDMLHRSSGVVENKSIYISSTGNVSVYAFNERYRSADGTVILPLGTLGKDYYVTSHFETMNVPVQFNPNINNESTLLVVAVENNTRIEITPSVFTLNGNAPNNPFFINLNMGQTYQLKARADLTGTRVRVVGDDAADCKNIAVFGGNKWTSVGDCGGANDHLFQQAYPTNTWGTDFFHIPLLGRTSGELVKVLASEPGTTITLDGNLVGTIDAGEFQTFDFDQDQLASIQTNKPSSVTVFAKSQECNDINLADWVNGDPFMITYSPNQQLLKDITFNALQLPSITNHYVNVVTSTATVGGTRLDGADIGNQFLPLPQSPDFSYARINIQQGVHKLSNPEGFIAYVYGFGFLESYGFAVGATLDNLNFQVEPEYEFDVQGEKVACLNANALWEINPENPIFTYFIWDFGDGTASKIGKEVNHTFTKPGTYEVKIKAAISQVSCDLQEEVVFEVEVLEITGVIEGMLAVCPNVEETTYDFVSEVEFTTIDWSVVGGVIVKEDGLSVTVLWGDTNPDASLMATPFTAQGCPGTSVTLGININPLLEPKAPEGEVKVCFDPTVTSQYSVPNPFAGRKFEWLVEGGEIVSGGESPTVEIRWNIPGTIGQVAYIERSVSDDFCAGESPKLAVQISAELTATFSQTDVRCFAGNNGRIAVEVLGGVAPYTYSWSHAASLNISEVDNLLVGTYSVTVTDDFGCQFILDNILITQPDVLEVLSISTQGVSCFGRSDGEAVIQIQGGLPPYALDIPGANINGSEISFLNLEGREFSGIVTDVNGCQLPISFTIDSPVPLTADVRIQKFSCPGEANGELIVEPTGDFGPFAYLWDHDGSQNMVLTGVQKGAYVVNVQDSRGCISIGTGEMLEEEPKMRMPTGFRPEEGLYEGVSNCLLSYQLSIYNRWGELIYLGSKGWDGTVQDQEAPLGTYIYIIQYEYNLNGEQTKKETKGLFSLLR